MTFSNKYRFVLTLAIIVAMLVTSVMLISLTDQTACVVAEAATIPPDNWENWGYWEVQKALITELNGDGTSTRPYEIQSPEDLAFLSKYVKEDGNTTGLYFKLTNNLDMDGALFAPIGTNTNPFNGSFQGSKYIIKNLYISGQGVDDAYIGLFGYAGVKSSISRLGIYGGIIKNNIQTSAGAVGALCGYTAGMVSECFSTADVIATYSDFKNVGGLVGFSVATITDVYTNASVQGGVNVGGIIGCSSVKIIGNVSYIGSLANSFALGDTTGTSCVGGVCGNAETLGINYPKFYYSYYNSDKNTELAYAIGAVNNVDAAPNQNYDTIYGSTRVTSWTEVQFHNSSVASYGDGFNKSGRWVDRFDSTDGSSRYAIGLTNMITDANSEIVKDSVIMRIYGYNGGEGTWGDATNPYVITNVTQFKHIAELVNQGTSYSGKYFLLDADLDLQDEECATIGIYGQAVNRPFKGTFDGNFHTIDNMVLDKTAEEDGKENYIGVFGYIDSNGVVKNLKIGSGCVFKGVQYVGSLAGRCDGTLSQIETYASVVASADSAGVVGYTANGSFTHILSNVQITQTTGATGALFGIIGSATGIKNLTNCWYVVAYNAVFKTTNSWGSVLVVDRNGSLIMEKDDEGNMSFTGVPGTGWASEFRHSSELVIDTSATGGIYTPSKSNTTALTIYARFVKTVECIEVSNATLTLSGSGKYYQGQTISLNAVVANGYYMNELMVTDISGKKATEAAYSYSDQTGIKATFTMGSTFKSVTADIKAINAKSIEPRAYDGTATSYSMDIEGFDITYSYSVGYAPKNAGNYTLTLIIRKDTIQRGKDYILFEIEKKQLSISQSDVLLEKEFDAYDGYVATTVSQANVDKIAGDDVIVNGEIYFTNHEAPTNEETGTGENGTVKFTLSGAAQANYLAPSSFDFITGKITKRTIYVEIEEKYLSRIYDGYATPISNFGVLNQLDSIPASIKLGFYLASDATKTACDALHVGSYGISVTSDSEYARDVYRFALKDDYTFVINPLAVAVNITGLNDLVYTGSAIDVTANFMNTFQLTSNDLSRDNSYEYYDLTFNYYRKNASGTYVLDADHTYAGSYKVEAVFSGDYGVDSAKTDSDKAINVAYYEVAKAESPTLTLNVSAGPYNFGGADVTLSYEGGSSETSDITYEVVSGCGSIADNILTFTGGGEVKLVVKKATSTNYLEGVSESVTLTVGKRKMTITLNDFSVDYYQEIAFPFEFSGFIQSDVDQGLTVPTGFVLPTIYINGTKWTSGTYYDASEVPYNVVIDYNASCDGYDFTYVNLEKSSPKRMTVEPRDITVKAEDVSVEYAEAEATKPYKVFDGETELTVTLVGALSRELGDDAGTYRILEGTVTNANNPNFNITFEEADYTITPLTLEVTMYGATKIYGEEDPELNLKVEGYAYGERWDDAVASGSITRRAGEDAYTATTDYGYYAYIGSTLVMSPNYTLVFHSANLTIYPLQVEFKDEDVTYPLEYGDALKDITPTIVVEGGVKGEFVWVNGNIVPNFSSSDTLGFDAVFTPETRNYKTYQTEIFVKVIPRELDLVIEYGDDLVYNGKVQKDLKYTLKNGLKGDNLLDSVTYEGDLLKAGEYKATINIGNKSYVVGGGNEVKITINPAPLTVYMEELHVPVGGEYDVKIVYDGFVNGENESVLTSRATLSNAPKTDVAGYYEITPSGASARNYKIIYKTTSINVYKPGITSDIQNFTISGEFDYRTVLDFGEIKKSERPSEFNSYSELYNNLKLANGISDESELQRLYNINVTLEGEDVSIQGRTITMEVPTRLRESRAIAIVFIQEDGTMTFADDVSVKGKELSFTAQDCAYIAIVCPPDYTWIILLAVIAFLLIAVFVIDAVTEKLGVGRHSEKAKAKKAAKKQQKATQKAEKQANKRIR